MRSSHSRTALSWPSAPASRPSSNRAVRSGIPRWSRRSRKPARRWSSQAAATSATEAPLAPCPRAWHEIGPRTRPADHDLAPIRIAAHRARNGVEDLQPQRPRHERRVGRRPAVCKYWRARFGDLDKVAARVQVLVDNGAVDELETDGRLWQQVVL